MPDANTIPFKQADPNGHYRSKQLPNDSGDFMLMLGLPAFAGDVVGPAGSTAGQVAVFDDGTGKRINVATQTGLAKLSSGVLSAVAAPSGAVVGTTDVQTLTNKTLITPTITGLTGLTKADVGLPNVDNTSDATKPVSGPQQAALDLKEDKNKKAVANGYASLDASAKVPLTQIPDSVVGGQQYQGTWNATTNTPTIPTAALGNKGWYYSVNVAGTTNINGINSWAVGDQIISNGSVWQKIANVSAVNSVNGYTGIVVLGKADVGLGNVDNTSDASKPVSAATVTQLNLKEDKTNKGVANGYAGLDATGKVPVANTPADLVTSVAAKQGVVTLVKADVGLSNVDNTSDATYSASTATLTNKTINGANNTLTVRLANDVTGSLPVTNLNAGTGANSGSFWRGDGQWAPPAGGGDMVGPGASVDGELVVFNSTTGKVVKRPTAATGFVKHTLNGAAVTQTQMGAADLAATVISGQTQKTTDLVDADEFLVLDSAAGPALRRLAASKVRHLPGTVVQTIYGEMTTADFGLVNAVTTPFTDTKGDQFMTQGITLLYSNSKVLVTFHGAGTIFKNPAGQSMVIVGLFITGTTQTLLGVPAGGYTENVVGIVHNFSFNLLHTPGSGGLKTYTLRGGIVNGGSQLYMNGYSFGGIAGYGPRCTLTLREIRQ